MNRLAQVLRALAALFSRLSGLPPVPRPMLAGELESAAVAAILRLSDDGSAWIPTRAVWADPARGRLLNSNYDVVEAPVAVVFVGWALPAEAQQAADVWKADQIARGAKFSAAAWSVYSPDTPASSLSALGIAAFVARAVADRMRQKAAD